MAPMTPWDNGWDGSLAACPWALCRCWVVNKLQSVASMQKGLYLWVLHSPQMGTHSPWVLVTDGKTFVTQPDDSNVSSQPMRVQLRESQEVFAKGQVWDDPALGLCVRRSCTGLGRWNSQDSQAEAMITPNKSLRHGVFQTHPHIQTSSIITTGRRNRNFLSSYEVIRKGNHASKIKGISLLRVALLLLTLVLSSYTK
jgi:hypothetical protein